MNDKYLSALAGRVNELKRVFYMEHKVEPNYVVLPAGTLAFIESQTLEIVCPIARRPEKMCGLLIIESCAVKYLQDIKVY